MAREKWISYYEEPGRAARIITDCDDELLSGILSKSKDGVAHDFPNETPLTNITAITLGGYRDAIYALSDDEKEQLSAQLIRMREHLSDVASELSNRDILQPLVMLKMILTGGEAQSLEASSRLIMMWQLLKTRLVLDYAVLRNEYAYVEATQPGND